MKTQDRADIAHIVRSLDIIVPGAGLVIVRAVVGQQVLEAHGVRSRIVCGSLMYRAGPSEDDDVLMFGGPYNHAIFFEDGDVSGHFWLETDDDLIDFSCGDWQSEWDLFVGPPINWTALPPEFWWRPRAELGTPASLHPWWSRSQATAPPLGSAWYREACDGEEVLQESATLGAAARLARQHTAQLIESGGRIRRTVVLPHAEDRA